MKINSKKAFLLLLITISLISGCKPTISLNSSETRVEKSKNFSVEMVRGAFNYDKLQLDETGEITYSKNNELLNTKTISKEKAEEFTNYIENIGFAELKNEYLENSTDTSSLRIKVKKGDTEKTVLCIDFERSCPPIMEQIQNEFFKLYGEPIESSYPG